MKSKPKEGEPLSFPNRNSKIFLYVRLALFGALVVVESLVLSAEFVTRNNFWGIPTWIFVLISVSLMLAVNVFKIFVCRKYEQKLACYIIDFLCMFVMMCVVQNHYLCIIYVIFLTEYYMSSPKLSHSIGMGVASVSVYIVAYGVSIAGSLQISIFDSIISCFSEVMILVVHFCIVNFAMNVYDSRQKMSETLHELDESNQKLQKAYNELQAVTVLQERQRIARDIHDTVGHSITTVIMQTEAAKLVIEEDSAEAKRRIVSANILAKNALDELRESVHLLAGDKSLHTLKDSLEQIIHDSMDGTDITIRYKIEDIDCVPAKCRFLENALKESISNGLRHGHATAFYFELYKTENSIRFVLSDNGTGVDVKALKLGFGLNGMTSRAESLGGKMIYRTFPDEGFEVDITLPR